MKNLTALLTALFACTLNFTFGQTNYTWTGAVNTSFTNSGNWTPSGVPANGDNVTIVATSNNPVLNATDTVNRLTITGGALDLGGHTLRVQGQLSVTGGTGRPLRLSNGKIVHRHTGTGDAMSNATVSCVVNSEGFGVSLTNMTMLDTVWVNKTIGAGSVNWGGCRFEAPVAFHNPSGFNSYMGVSNPDTFLMGLTMSGIRLWPFYSSAGNYVQGDLSIHATGTFWVANGSGSSVTVDGDIIISKTTANNLSLGNAGTIYQTAGHALALGPDSLVGGGVLISKLIQEQGCTADLPSTTGVSYTQCVLGNVAHAGYAVNLHNCTVVGSANLAVGSVSIQGSTFNGTTVIKKTGGTSNFNYGNKFNGPTTIEQASTTHDLWWGTGQPDTFRVAVTLINTTARRLEMGNTASCVFMGHVTAHRTGSGALNIGYYNAGGLARFAGNSDQTFTSTGTSLPLSYYTQIDKSGGALTLASDLDVAYGLTLASGIIKTTGSAVLKLRDNATVTGASDASYVEGRVLKVGNDAFTFPVGRNGAYRPIAISAPSSTSAEFRAEYKNLDPNEAGYDTAQKDGTLGGVSTNEYWLLDRLASSNNVSVTLKWAAMSCAVDTLSKVRVAAWDPAGAHSRQLNLDFWMKLSLFLRLS